MLATTQLIIEINGEIFIIDIDISPADRVLASISPASASPIIPQLLTLNLSPFYDVTDFDTDEFTVGLVTDDPALARPNGDLVRYLNVVDRDEV